MHCNILLCLQRTELVGRCEKILIRFTNKDVITGVWWTVDCVVLFFSVFFSTQVVGGELSNLQLLYTPAGQDTNWPDISWKQGVNTALLTWPKSGGECVRSHFCWLALLIVTNHIPVAKSSTNDTQYWPFVTSQKDFVLGRRRQIQSYLVDFTGFWQRLKYINHRDMYVCVYVNDCACVRACECVRQCRKRALCGDEPWALGCTEMSKSLQVRGFLKKKNPFPLTSSSPHSDTWRRDTGGHPSWRWAICAPWRVS